MRILVSETDASFGKGVECKVSLFLLMLDYNSNGWNLPDQLVTFLASKK